MTIRVRQVSVETMDYSIDGQTAVTIQYKLYLGPRSLRISFADVTAALTSEFTLVNDSTRNAYGLFKLYAKNFSSLLRAHIISNYLINLSDVFLFTFKDCDLSLQSAKLAATGVF